MRLRACTWRTAPLSGPRRSCSKRSRSIGSGALLKSSAAVTSCDPGRLHRLDTVLRQLVVERLEADPQERRRLALVLVRLVERTEDLVALELADSADAPGRRRVRRRRDALQHVVRQVLGAYEPGATQHHRALDDVAQLTHVAWPAVPVERA